MKAAWRTALLLLLSSIAAAAVATAAVAAAQTPPPPPPPPLRPPPTRGAQPAEPGEGEAAALAELAAAMGADPGLLASWDEAVASEGSLCGWPISAEPAIFCDNSTGTITAIYLIDSLNGTLPDEGWMALGSLTRLSIRGTGLGGELAAAFPASLQDLWLQQTNLSSIGPAWRPPPHLRTFWMSGNQWFNQSLAEQLGWLAAAPELRNLTLWGNYLVTADEWVDANANLTILADLPPFLKHLELVDHQLSGALLPIHLPNTLQFLRLEQNGLCGSLPTRWALPHSLTVLSLGSNLLTGTLPPTIQLPDGLQALSIAYNSLSGTIPPSWLPPNLTHLDASFNEKLSLPSDGCSPLPASLISIDLQWNQMALAGPLPASIMHLPCLESISLYGCNLNGTLPAAPLPRSLTFLDLGHNDLSGSVPWAAWALPDSFQSLDLAGNRLNGSLPSALPASLTMFELVHNAFSGSLPATLLERLPTNLSHFDVSHNRLTGPLPQAFTLPRGGYLDTVDLSFNNFSGPFPSAWNCGPARGPGSRLNLNDNQLSGALPATPSFLAFSTVDLSNNRLAGTLPGWDPEGRQLGATVIALPQQGPGFCGQVPPAPLDSYGQPSPVFYRKDPDTGQTNPLKPGDLPPCGGSADQADPAGSSSPSP